MIRVGEYLFRYEEIACSRGTNEYDDPLPGYDLVLHLHKFKKLKRTPKGVWISLYSDLFENKKFVLLAARKRYACPTKKEALISFIARKRRQIEIIKYQLEKAERALKLAEGVAENDTSNRMPRGTRYRY